METQEQELEHIDNMLKANERAEVILDKLLSDGKGELSIHEVLNALALALIHAANDCGVNKDAFFATVEARWDEVQEGLESVDLNNETLH